MDAYSSLALEKLLTTKQLLHCIDTQRAEAQKGRVAELAELAVELGYVTTEQLDSEVGRLHSEDVTPEEVIELALAEETVDVPTPAPVPGQAPRALRPTVSVAVEPAAGSASKGAKHEVPQATHEPVPAGMEVPSMTFAVRLREMAGKSLVGGTLLGCHIKSLVGQGPIADVYRVEKPGTDKELCLKVFTKSLFKSTVTIRRFLSRARLCSRLNHPNILQPIEFGETEHNLCYIISNFVEGVPLWLLLRRQSQLKERTVLASARFIAKALKFAHTQGIVHGNLKPSNILFTSKGAIVVLDWGSPRVCLLLQANRIQREGHRLDSVSEGSCYSAPEVVTGEAAEIAQASDLYSLGGLMYNMFTGHPPFPGTHEEVAAVITKTPFPDLPPDLEGVSTQGRHLLKYLTAYDPDDRPKDAQEVITIIENRLKEITRKK